MPVDLKSKLLPGLWTAVLYAATGWLSLQICIPPDYVSLMFLPAGMALGMALTQGAWALPGVALGSLAVQWMAGQQAGLENGLSWTLLVAPLGAALQAWLGAWLARRWVAYPDPVETPQRVTLLLLGVGPLSTVVNASVSVPVLVHSGLIPASEAVFSWWTWWLGDAVGAVLGLPLVLVFLGQPAAAWRARRLSVAVPLLLALLVVGAVVYETKTWEEQRIRNQLSQYAHEQAGLLQRRLDAQNDSVQAIARVMQISRTAPEVPQAEAQADFSITVQHWLERYGGTQNFGWSPLVQRSDRAAYEAGRWLIKGRSATGETFAAALRDSYLPITLIEPLASNTQALGLDVAVLPATADSVAATRTTGQPRVSEGIRLVQEVGEQRAVVMYQAVFQPHSTLLKGVVSAVFRMDDVLQALGTAASGPRPESCLIDPQAAPGNRRLAGPTGCDQAEWRRGPMGVQLPLQFGGREWSLQVRANAGFLNQARDLSAWAMVALSLLCVGLLGAFLLVITGQTRRTQALVDQRTLELAALAHYDSLTGLPNRSQWVTRGQAELKQALQSQQALAVLFLDLDHFKHINDTLGHALGDELLQAVSQRLQPCLQSHHLLARIGGDEFVALLPQLQGPEEAAQVAERLRRALQAPLYIQGHEINLSASIGIACYPQDGDTLDHLLKHADTAMYVAKDAGRNGYQFFMKEMNARVSRRMFLENNLRRALERDELFLVYQPQIDAASGRVAGVEALVRWRHPEEGLIPPDRFIPVAEDCGLIEPLGAWVLHQACRQLQDWTHVGETELMMAVNISPMQFRKSGFIDMVRHALSASGVNPARIELEITETLLMQPLKDLDNRLRELADMGLTFALDDFGTGYSSLGYLKRLPISRIKLDKSFVADLPGDVEDEAITRATLSMAKDLGLRCVAEGVETEAQRRFLSERGCDTLQGYLFARPMPAEECRDWLRRYRSEWAERHAGGRVPLRA